MASLKRMPGPSRVSEDSAERAAVQRLRTYFRGLDAGSTASRACELRDSSGRLLAVPAPLLEVLIQATEELARGGAVAVVPIARELTTQQAADLLNVSRQYLVRLVDDGKLPCVRTGSHRRLQLEDVLGFKAKRDRERADTLDELTRLHEELGGYE